MTAAAEVPRNTARPALDEAVGRLRDGARPWAVAPLPTRIGLARAIQHGLAAVAERSARAACAAKGHAWETPGAGEEWLGGPYIGLRFIRQVLESLEGLAARGATPEGPLSRAADGRLVERLFPAGALDRLVFLGLTGEVHYQEGVDPQAMRQARAAFHRDPEHQGKVCLVLGAGNVNSIPVADVLTKLFNEGKSCLLKCNPVNAYVGPFVEEAFREAIERGWLRVVYGGAEEGSYLAHHPGVDEVHITGSDRTHDAIVWGPPGPDRAARMARGQPLLAKEISSELGNVTPILVVPGPWTPRQLEVQAESVAGMVVNNASFNCIAGKMLVLPRGWRHRERFLDLVMGKLGLAAARTAWYPGAQERYRGLTAGRSGLRTAGLAGEGTLPWTLIPGLDAGDAREPAFRTEPFCAILSETQLGSEDPVEFLRAAVPFANDRLWGTLSAVLLVAPGTVRDPAAGVALERAIRELRYGSVCVNVWSAFAYLTGTLPWGAYPGASPSDIQSGRGFVHNTRMVEGVEKVVVRGPATPLVKLPHLPSHRTAHLLGRRLTALEAGAGWRAMPSVLAAALRG